MLAKTRATALLTLALLSCPALAQTDNDESGLSTAPPVHQAASATNVTPEPGTPQEQGFSFTVPEGAASVLLSLSGTDASIVSGSARLDGQTLADPQRLPGGVGWVVGAADLKATSPHTFTATLTGSKSLVPGLAVKYPDGRTETIAGPQAYSEPEAAPVVTEGEGLLRNLTDGQVLSDRENLTVVVQGQLSAGVSLQVNGVPVPNSQVGRRAENSGEDTLRLDFIGVPLVIGENQVTATSGATSQTVKVFRAGPAQSLELETLSAVADSVTPLSFRVTVLDAGGRRASLPSVTVDAQDLTTPDSDPQQAGVQVALRNGQAVVTLQPRSAAGPLELTFEVNSHTVVRKIDVRPDTHTTMIGRGSVGLSGVGSDVSGTALTADGQVTLETPLAGGQLTVLADGRGLHDDASLTRPALGDASSERRTLQADGAFAVRYERPGLSAQYARNAQPDPVFLASPVSDTLQVITRAGDTGASLTLTPGAGNEVTQLLPLDGSRLARLPAGATRDSVRLTLITSKAGEAETRQVLRNGFDYVIDASGLIVFSRTPPIQDTQLEATFRLETGQGDLAVTGSVTHHWNTGSVSAGVTSAPGYGMTAGARVRDHFENEARISDVDAVVTASASGVRGSVQASVASKDQLKPGSYALSLSGTSQQGGYSGALASSDGTSATLTASRVFAPGLSTVAQSVLYDLPGADTRFGISADVVYALNPVTSFRAGLGQSFLPAPQTSVRAGVHSEPGDWVLDAALQQAVSGQQNETTPGTVADLKASYRLRLGGEGSGSELRFGVKSHLERSDGLLIAVNSLILEGRNGPVLATASYDLPTLAGDVGVARFGVNASWPISPTLSLTTAASLTSGTGRAADQPGSSGWTAVLSNDLHGLTPYGQWTAGLDLIRAMSGPRFALRGGYALSSENAQGQDQAGTIQDGLTLSSAGSLVAQGGPDGTGLLLNLSAAARRADTNGSLNLNYKAGTLGTTSASTQELTLGSGLSLHAQDHEVRLGLAARLDPQDAASLVLAPSAAARLFLTNEWSAGAAYTGLYQPSTTTWSHAFGVEAGYTFLPGSTFNVGYNFTGYDGFGGGSTRPGLYLRLDLSGATGEPR